MGNGRGLGAIDPVTASFIIAGVNTGIGLLFNRKGNAQKEASTNIVNQVEPLLKENRDTFLASEPKTAALKAQALLVFENAWKNMVAMLSDPALGEAGQRGVADRGRGGQWDWWSYYYDPIVNEEVEGFSYQDFQQGKLYGSGASIQGGGRDEYEYDFDARWSGIACLGFDGYVKGEGKMLGVDAYAYHAAGPFGDSDFVNWENIKDDFGNNLTLGNAFLSESGARKVMSAIGLSAPVENRLMEEGWNGRYEDGVVYGSRSAVYSRPYGPWRYKLPNWSGTWGNGWIWLDGYIPLIIQGKNDIARYLFRNEDNPNIQRALQYLIPTQYGSAGELETAINSFNQGSAGTGVQVNLGTSTGATGTTNGGGNMSEESVYTEGSTDTSPTNGTVSTTGATDTNTGNSSVPTSGGFDLSSIMENKIDIAGVQIPTVVLIGGAVAALFMFGGGGD